MHTINEVRLAMKQQDRKRAMQILKEILHEEPSADAWYLAARMTRDKNKAAKYLQRALWLDPKHNGARNLMERLGIKQKSETGFFLDEVMDAFFSQADRSPLLRRFNRPIQLALSILMIMAFLMVATTLVSAIANQVTPIEIAAEAPAPVELTIHETESVATFLRNSSLNLTGVEIVQYDLSMVEAMNTTRTWHEEIQFYIADNTGNYQLMTVYVYETLPALMRDSERLDSLEAYSSVMIFSNVVLVSPLNFQGAATGQLITLLQTLNS